MLDDFVCVVVGFRVSDLLRKEGIGLLFEGSGVLVPLYPLCPRVLVPECSYARGAFLARCFCCATMMMMRRLVLLDGFVSCFVFAMAARLVLGIYTSLVVGDLGYRL